MECRNQQHLVQKEVKGKNLKPISAGVIHGEAKAYEIFKEDGTKLGEYVLCDECIEGHRTAGWVVKLKNE